MREGYKQTINWEDKEWTPTDLRDEIIRLCQVSAGRLSQERYWRVKECATWLASWLDTHVREDGKGS